jgi:SAM-dependent methyltransferase
VVVGSEAPATDAARAAAFGDRIAGLLNESMLALMISVGHRTGLFDVMAMLPPSTSHEVADAAGLDERYVREWLGAMTVGRIVEHDGEAKTYRLPAEHAAFLTRAAGNDNLAMQAQYVSLLGGVEDDVVRCFREGGGVPYSRYARFQELMAEDSAMVHDANLLDATLPLVDGLADRLREGIDVADVGCGAGHALNLMAAAFPASRFVGFEISDEAIEAGAREAASMDLTNVRFERRDAASLDGKERFDFITTFDAVHDQARPDLVLAGIAASLRDDGVYLCVDIAGSSEVANNLEHPIAPYVYTFSTMHCMTVSLAEGGMGLGAAWGRELALAMLAHAGFTDVRVEDVEGDPINHYYIARKG